MSQQRHALIYFVLGLVFLFLFLAGSGVYAGLNLAVAAILVAAGLTSKFAWRRARTR